MRYDNLIKYFETSEGITELLNILKVECFDVVDEIREQLLVDAISSSDDLQKTKTTLATIAANLQPIYSKALSLKKQIEYRYCVEHKEDGSAAYVEKAAKAETKVYRDIRDILCGYLNSCNGLLYECRDRIEGNRREYHNTER